MAVGSVTGIDLMVERKMRGISQAAVAAHMGTSKQYVSNLEGSLNEPVTPDAARKYRDALDAAVQTREAQRPTIATLQPSGEDIAVLNDMDYPAASAWARGWLSKHRHARLVQFNPGFIRWEAMLAICDVLTSKGIRVVVLNEAGSTIRRHVR